jgi:hypothetical protein
LVQVVAGRCADRSPQAFAPFLLAATVAAEGRDTVGFAPAMPASPGPAVDEALQDIGDPDQIAAYLAALLTVLRGRLESATSQCHTVGDRQACVQAARLATEIHGLLAPG